MKNNRQMTAMNEQQTKTNSADRVNMCEFVQWTLNFGIIQCRQFITNRLALSLYHLISYRTKAMITFIRISFSTTSL